MLVFQLKAAIQVDPAGLLIDRPSHGATAHERTGTHTETRLANLLDRVSEWPAGGGGIWSGRPSHPIPK